MGCGLQAADADSRRPGALLLCAEIGIADMDEDIYAAHMEPKAA